MMAERQPGTEVKIQPIGICLLCGYEPDYEKGEHLPSQLIIGSLIWACVECVTRCKTVTSFGLTVDEPTKKRRIRAAAREITDGFVSPMPEWRKHKLNTIRRIERVIAKHLGGPK